MKISDLYNALDALTGERERNMDLDVLFRVSQNDGDDLMIASNATLTLEETCADDTLFIDVSDEEDAEGERLGEAVRAALEPDTIPAPPPERHLKLVKENA